VESSAPACEIRRIGASRRRTRVRDSSEPVSGSTVSGTCAQNYGSGWEVESSTNGILEAEKVLKQGCLGGTIYASS
jgi:hypothetical protein